MKTTLRNQGVSSSHLQAYLQGKEKILMQKSKTMVLSKSEKNISVNTLSNPFKKGERRVEARDLSEKTMNCSPVQVPSSEVKQASRSVKANNLASNKIIANEQEQSTPNPEHFLMRNQLYEKQKEMKLQFERRKKLYGINSEKKIKPNLFIKENESTEEEAELAQKAKTYKEMYYRKYGKNKVYEQSKGKKKSKNYEQLMKESIERFNEKFMLGLDGKIVHPSSKDLMFTSQEHTLKTNVTNIAEVQEKIKTLMKKLNLEEEMNISVQTIEELSRIETLDDAKISEINSSGLFPKTDQDNHFEEIGEMIIPIDIQGNDQAVQEQAIIIVPQEIVHTPIVIVPEQPVVPEPQLHLLDNKGQQKIIEQQKVNPCLEQKKKQIECIVSQPQAIKQQPDLFEDIDIAIESEGIIQAEALSYADLSFPKVGNGLIPYIPIQQNSPQAIVSSQPPSINIQQTQEIQAIPQQLLEDSSQECTYEVCLQSFIDLEGNCLQNVQVQVQNFGFCRFLIASDSDSDS